MLTLPVRAVIELGFDPVLRIGESGIRWQAICLALAILAALAVAAALAGRAPGWNGAEESPARANHAHVSAGPRGGQGQPDLRVDDLVYVVLGAVPGAVVGGRLIHALAYFDHYAADPGALLDPSTGSLSLLGAVIGGTLSAGYVSTLLYGSVRRWADAAAVPLLLVIGLGKIAQFLGGSGQGAPWSGPWAVAFVGPGPWVTLQPAVPAHPAQVYEGLWALLGVAVVLAVVRPSRDVRRLLLGRQTPVAGARYGRLFVAAVGWWLAGRVLVGFTWRDQDVLGPLNAEQIAALVTLGAFTAAVALLRLRRRARSPRRSTGEST